MPDISPYIMGSINAFAHAAGVGHLTLVASIAVGSAVVNYYLDLKGHTLVVKLLNRALWIVGGLIFMDFFFDAISKARFMLHV